MSTTQLDDLLNATLGQIRYAVHSIQTGTTTLDNSTYILKQLHGIIYNIHITHYTNSPRSDIIEDICTLVTSDLCETFNITSEYTQHIISQTTRDIFDATDPSKISSQHNTHSTTTPKKPTTSRSPHLSKKKLPTRNAHSVNNFFKKTTTTTTFYPTMTTMREIRRTFTNILNKMSYIALIAQLGYTTSNKT